MQNDLLESIDLDDQQHPHETQLVNKDIVMNDDITQ